MRKEKVQCWGYNWIGRQCTRIRVKDETKIPESAKVWTESEAINLLEDSDVIQATDIETFTSSHVIKEGYNKEVNVDEVERCHIHMSISYELLHCDKCQIKHTENHMIETYP